MKNITFEKDKGILIFKITGELDERNTDETFKYIDDILYDFFDKKVLLDLKELKIIGSRAMGYILNMKEEFEGTESDICLLIEEGEIKDIIELVGIGNEIKCFEDKEEAISFLHKKNK